MTELELIKLASKRLTITNLPRPEIHQIRGLSGSSEPLELPCLVDQVNCGEVYYITWTRQSLPQSTPSNSSAGPIVNGVAFGQSQQQSAWTRVYLYTGSNDSSPHKPIGDLLNRATFIMPERHQPSALAEDEGKNEPMAKLVIEEPTLADEALYKCDVTYVKGKCPSINLVRVHMMALPEKAQILALPMPASGLGPIPLAEGATVGPYNEHDQLRLTCLVRGGRPAPKSVIWRRVDNLGRTTNLAPAKNLNLQHSGLSLEVVLNHTLTSADLGSRFECHTDHEALERQSARVVVSDTKLAATSTLQDSMTDLHPAPSESNSNDLPQIQPPDNQQNSRHLNSLDSHVLVDLNVGVASLDLFMAKVNKANASEPLKEGDLLELECVAYNSRPAANISWFNGADPIEQLDVSGRNALATVTVSPYSPSPDDGLSGASSRSPPIKQRHKRLLQRNQIHQNSDGQTFNTHSFLSIKLSRHEHRARISCQAQNVAMRQPLAKSLELQVQHAPIVLMEPAAGISINEGSSELTVSRQFRDHVIPMPSSREEVSIYCIYTANPFELTANSTRWFKDGQLLSNVETDLGSGDSQEVAHLTQSLTATGYPMLKIHQVNRRDAGFYDCQVANSVGVSERLPASESCKLEVNFRPSVSLRLLKPITSSPSRQLAPNASGYRVDELIEVDLDKELVLAGSSLVLQCDILEARPQKIHKFLWHKHQPITAAPRFSHQNQQEMRNANGLGLGRGGQLISQTETGQFVLNSLAVDFAAGSYSCSASNSLGSSELSNQIDIQLSYTPGPSEVIPISDLVKRNAILASGGPPPPNRMIETPETIPRNRTLQSVGAGSDLLLECLTQDLGRPRANVWLWFKDGKSLESSQLDQRAVRFGYESNSLEDLTSGSSSYNNKNHESQENSDESPSHQTRIAKTGVKLIASGRYLYIASVQLSHRGNYSCLAANRLGTGTQQKSQDSYTEPIYQLKVTLAPSFVQPLASRTLWSETSNIASDDSKSLTMDSHRVELVCHVQCDPICQIEWLRNNELIDTRKQSDPLTSSYLSHRVEQTLLDENETENTFKSVKSKLILHLEPIDGKNLPRINGQPMTRDKILERRRFMNGANYTCQSSPNSVGPSVKSTSRFIVQYPPENVLINSLGDKLNLVEGSNGPRLSCEASGEPRVQFRWFLVRSNTSRILAIDSLGASVKNQTHPVIRADLEFNGSKEFEQLAASSRIESSDSSNNREDLYVDITNLASEQIGGASGRPVSVLDLHGVSIDRKQAGHYVCEASNKLAASRQSVYVNVLYKPSCTTLHLHSLDLVEQPSIGDADKDSNAIFTQTTPYKADPKDEYSLIQETSEDFIDLTKILLMGPVVARHSMGTTSMHSGASIKDSIFQNIPSNLQSSETIGNIKDTSALISESSREGDSKIDNLLLDDGSRGNQLDSQTESSATNTWYKFNSAILKFLNDYMRQVKLMKEGIMMTTNEADTTPTAKRQNRRFDHSTLTSHRSQEMIGGIRNLVTFACIPRDGNPMNNITFDWSFGSTKLPESSGSSGSSDESSSQKSNQMLIYANGNSTFKIYLVRRYDTKSALIPFQISLLSLDIVVLDPLKKIYASRVTREVDESQTQRIGQSRIPVIRSRHHSRAPQDASRSVLFSQELDTNSFASGPHIQLNEENWQDQLDSLLKCSITNEIGTSEPCPAKVNIVERAKSRASSSEYAKWRMPSLAHKSLLIVSILIGCALAIFVTTTLLLGPHVKSLNMSRSQGDGSDKTDSNTGQSTSSQKSSVMGLLGNGDSSLQGSSDDDSSARLNNLGLAQPIGQSNKMLDMDSSDSRTVYSNSCRKSHNSKQIDIGYDLPRTDRYVYRQGHVNYGSNDVGVDVEQVQSVPYHQSSTNIEPAIPRSDEISTGSRLLTNLKSLSKFKVDRVSDLANFGYKKSNTHSSLHIKTVSNSETNTTGVSISGLEKDFPLSPTSPNLTDSSAFFRQSNVRQSHLGFSRRQQEYRQRNHLEPSHYLYEQTDLRNQVDPCIYRDGQYVIQGVNTPIFPAYSNMREQKPYDAMEEFMRQRGIEPNIEYTTSSSASRSQLMNNDLNQYYQKPSQPPRTKPKPMVNPRFQSMTSSYSGSVETSSRPQIATRSFARINHNEEQAIDNRYSLPPYGQTFTSNHMPISSVRYLDTIDNRSNMINMATHLASSQQTTYANAGTYAKGHYDDLSSQRNPSNEHIYDVNAYATPEQTPMRRLVPSQSLHQAHISKTESERPRVSQLIESFNTKIPERPE